MILAAIGKMTLITSWKIQTPTVLDDDRVHDILVPEANIHVVSNKDVLTTEESMSVSTVYNPHASSSNQRGFSTEGLCAVQNNGGKKKKLKQKIKELKCKLNKIKDCVLEMDVLIDFEENVNMLTVFSEVCNLNRLVDLIVAESNRYTEQNGRTVITNAAEIKAFLGVIFNMTIVKLRSMINYWDSDSFIGNNGIKSMMTRQRFQDIIQNLHFCNNRTADVSDKGYKIRQVIDIITCNVRCKRTVY